MSRQAVATRAGVFVAVVVGILILAAVTPGLVLPEQRVGAGPEHPAWNSSDLDPEMVDASGTPDPDGDVGTVLFDASHGNRYDREDITPLVGAITQAGGSVEFVSFTGDLESRLEDADVFVVIDPSVNYGADEVDVIRAFVRDGGRLVVFGEPNRRDIFAQGIQPGLEVQRSTLTTLGAEFGITFGTEYLYDMSASSTDGGFKNVLATPARGAGDFGSGIDRVALYTATPVRVDRGRVLLRTAPSAEHQGRTTDRGFPVAAVTADGSILAIGDKTFMHSDNAAVADNEVLVAHIVEFMAAAG